MLTCIINQFDCKAGTKGLDSCMTLGRIRLAKLMTKKVMGNKRAPSNFVPVFVSVKTSVKSKHQSRKSSDSYKLLRGK